MTDGSHSVRLLLTRRFGAFWFGSLLSNIGTWMQSVAQGWLMHRLTGSAFMLGILSFTQFLPALPLAMLAGVIADRTDRRRMLMWTQGLLLAQSVLLALLVSFGAVQPWMVIALALLLTRQADAHRNDILSIALGKHAWKLLGSPAGQGAAYAQPAMAA